MPKPEPKPKVVFVPRPGMRIEMTPGQLTVLAFVALVVFWFVTR